MENENQPLPVLDAQPIPATPPPSQAASFTAAPQPLQQVAGFVGAPPQQQSAVKAVHAWLVIILLALILAVNIAGVAMQIAPVNRSAQIMNIPNDGTMSFPGGGGGGPNTTTGPSTNSNAA